MKKLTTVLAVLSSVVALNVQATITDVPGSHFIVTGADSFTAQNPNWYYEGKLYNSSSATILTDSAHNGVGRVFAYDTSTANVSGSGYVNYLNVYGNSTANVTGGQVGYLSLYENSTASISAGYWVSYLSASGDSSVTMAPGSAFFIGAYDNTTITLSGSASGVIFGEGVSLAADGRTILGVGGNVYSGVFDPDSGDYTWSFQITGNNGNIAFAAPVPEPSTYVAGALLLLPFGASVMRKLRKA